MSDLICPNCGDDWPKMQHHWPDGFRISCIGCYLKGPICSTEAEARAAFLMPAARADERRKVIEELTTLRLMETAPRDGTPILLFDGLDWFLGQWFDVFSWWRSCPDSGIRLGDGFVKGWLPLPELPK